MSIARHHAEWLSLVEQSGPFLSMPVLLKHFNTGLEAHDPERFRTLKMAYEEWEDKWKDPAIHNEWIKHVLNDLLELDKQVVAEGQARPQSLSLPVAEHGEILWPDFVVRAPNGGTNRMLVKTYPATQDLEKPIAGKTWKASPSTRMMELLHSTNIRLGLITNGEHWMLVDAPRGETTGFASWYGWLWLQEPITLRAFRSLLSVERFFGVPDDQTLEAMLKESAENQQEVTDQLGYQVRSAVEILVQTLDRADQDHDRKLLANVTEPVLYEAALTVMMRLVFSFYAEEQEPPLLPTDDEFYTSNYSVSSLGKQLRETSDQHGEEVLERRHDAWCRLLSTFRAVHGGVSHDRFNLPAYGGHLFDPDRFPFLEGRQSETSWRDTPADPLPVDNRTVLHLLEALQLLEMRIPGGGGAEKRRLSFRALDIEQIGHVYEGLLDHTAKRAPEPVLGFGGAKDKEPEILLSKLESEREKGDDQLLKFLKKETGRSPSALRNGLNVELEAVDANRFQAACGGDHGLWERVKPFAGLVRDDTFGRPVVIPQGSVYVTAGTDRRSSGTHYTPVELTRPIVQYTLEPLVYEGPAEGKPKEEWKRRSAKELLDLNICDMACGSGAFLVQACRYMSERLMEAWDEVEKQHPTSIRITPHGEPSSGEPGEMLIPKDLDERVVYARRIVAGRCLYGVDKNPLACEMAKLSLWLLTLAKDMPFTFLDHAIRCGDSLVGISSIEQLEQFSLNGGDAQLEFAQEAIRKKLDTVRLLRRQIEERFDSNVEDTEQKTLMLKNADEQIRRLAYAADHLIAVHWQPMSQSERERELSDTLRDVEFKFKDLPVEELDRESARRLQEVGCQRTFHWPLEFPEVFDQGGFSVLLCNPPFQGGKRITGSLGVDYRNYLVDYLAQGKRGNADLCAYFFLRTADLLSTKGDYGLLATNTIAEGDTREVGLDQLAEWGMSIPRAVRSGKWPGSASLEVAQVWGYKGGWNGTHFLNGTEVTNITPFLTEKATASGPPNRLRQNANKAFIGTVVYGQGFVLSPEQAQELIARNQPNAEVIHPYINGDDLNSSPSQSPSRFVINFGGRTEEEARRYPECFEIVERLVKPYRMTVSEKRMREKWWLHQRPRPALYSTISGNRHVLVKALTSKHHALAFVPNGWIYDQTSPVFAFDDWLSFGILQSDLHCWWALAYGASLETRPRYTPSDCFETFPFPPEHDERFQIAGAGEQYHEHRRQLMLDRQEGLTKTYNRFHDPDETASDIQKLRELHVEMDNAVAAAYDWADLDLGHGFHETKQGLRYTICEEARREVLQRLLKLNHERYEEEVRQGLHEKKKALRGRKKRVASSALSDQKPLFD